MTALQLKNISKYYASQTAVVMGLSNVSLSFSTGEFVAITGENGSGKSTLANVIGGMLPYEGGELYVMGQPTSHYNAADWERYRRDMIGFISQDYGILPGNTVFENVESALVLSGCERSLAKEKTRDILKKVELSDYSRRRASKLSSGQKQRLAIARALAKPSKILIADEPTGNLDRENSDKVIRLLKEASRDRLVILITHEFSEAKDLVTRHVVLSEGKVVQDTEVAEPSAAPEEEERPKKAAKRDQGKNLAPYIARLTAKARPVFFFLTAMILLITCVASFIFVGNFIVATDDVPSRVYDNKAFRNGDPTRLVIAKDVTDSFTDEEIALIRQQKYISSVEKYGYIADVNYYYREDIHYRKYSSAEYEEGYDPIFNPDAFSYTVKIEFLGNDPKYMSSVSRAGELTAGRMAEDFYEVLSSDPDYTTGMKVRVFVRNRMHWGISQYIGLDFTVVGETTGERGLYFSESLCKMLNNSVLAAIYNQGGTFFSGGDLGRYPIVPYDYAQFKDAIVPVYPEGGSGSGDDNGGMDDDVHWRPPERTPAPRPTPTPEATEMPTEDPDATAAPTEEPTEEPTAEPTAEPAPAATPVIPETLAENEFVYPADPYGKNLKLGSKFVLSIGDFYARSWDYDGESEGVVISRDYELYCAGIYNSSLPRMVLVNPEMYKKMTDGLHSNQATVYITDYAYTQRAIDELASMGYVVLSPFTQGSTVKDADLEAERINLLRITLAASVLTLVLQLILLKVTFSSLKDHYKLLLNMGLRAKTAYSSLALLFLFLTLVAEALAAAVILILNHYGYARVVNIFKYLETPSLILIFAIHLVFCVIAYFIVARSLKKQVFSISGFYEDIDGELMEEVMGE
ncbi:MAG: ABC transporter ATP-binding protein [Clostridia bacterium]|nr:ABC transporter ATP-binding protein [Clostridia bacterium]